MDIFSEKIKKHYNQQKHRTIRISRYDVNKTKEAYILISANNHFERVGPKKFGEVDWVALRTMKHVPNKVGPPNYFK